MRTTAAALTATTLLLAAALTGCSSSATASPAACKTAMAEQLDTALAQDDNATPGTRPDACNGIDDKTLQRITSELVSEQAGQRVDESLDESAAPDAPLSAECRAWLEAELVDTSDSIDAEGGQTVCGDLSDEEMDQAIEDVTNDLIKQGSTAP